MINVNEIYPNETPKLYKDGIKKYEIISSVIFGIVVISLAVFATLGYVHRTDKNILFYVPVRFIWIMLIVAAIAYTVWVVYALKLKKFTGIVIIALTIIVFIISVALLCKTPLDYQIEVPFKIITFVCITAIGILCVTYSLIMFCFEHVIAGSVFIAVAFCLIPLLYFAVVWAAFL